jgi:hypothetical protein
LPPDSGKNSRRPISHLTGKRRDVSNYISLASSIGAKFVDPLDFLCDTHRCPTVDKDGVPYFKDDGHYRSGAVITARFQFLDDAAGVNTRMSAAPMPPVNNP